MEERIGLTLPDLEHLVLCSVGYCLGRSTHAVSTTCELVRRLASSLHPTCRRTLLKQIRDQERWGYGHPMDHDEWLDLVDFLEGEEQQPGSMCPSCQRRDTHCVCSHGD